MTARSGQCPDCGGHYRLRPDGTISTHSPVTGGGGFCDGVGQAPREDPDAYTVGRDHDPWVLGGGGWEQDRRGH